MPKAPYFQQVHNLLINKGFTPWMSDIQCRVTSYRHPTYMYHHVNVDTGLNIFGQRILKNA